MDNSQIIQPSIPPVEPQKSWLSKHMLLGIVFLFAIITAAISGIYYWQTISQIPSSVQFPMHKDVTADWKTYTNTQYGFSFKYPAGHELIKDDAIYSSLGLEVNSVFFAIEDKRFDEMGYNDTFGVTVIVGPKLEDHLKSGSVTRYEEGIASGKLQMSTFAGKPAIIDNSGFMIAAFFTAHVYGEDDSYFIEITQGSNKALLSQILSTFKFTNQDMTAGWKIYTSSRYGFSFKYPSDWTFTTSTNTISFFPPGKSIDLKNEYTGDIIVSVIKNPNNLDLKTFYTQQGPNNLFSNSVSQIALNINGYPAEKFMGVYGMIPADSISINKGDTVIELTDVGQQHGEDGIFDTIANSVK